MELQVIGFKIHIQQDSSVDILRFWNILILNLNVYITVNFLISLNAIQQMHLTCFIIF